MDQQSKIAFAALPLALLKIETAAAIAGCTPRHLRRKIAAGEFPQPIHFNARCIMFRAEDVDAWRANAGHQARGTAKVAA